MLRNGINSTLPIISTSTFLLVSAAAFTLRTNLLHVHFHLKNPAQVTNLPVPIANEDLM